MKNSWHFSAILLFLLSSCINGEQTYQVDYTNLLCGGNSKIWELDLTKTSENESPRFYTWGKGVFVFYFSGKVEIGSLQDFATKTSDTGTFTYNQSNQILTVKVEKEIWKFQMSLDRDGALWLKTIQGTGLSKYMHLVPLREPKKV